MREGYFQTMYGGEARNEAGRFVGEVWIIDLNIISFSLIRGGNFYGLVMVLTGTMKRKKRADSHT